MKDFEPKDFLMPLILTLDALKELSYNIIKIVAT